MYELLSILVAIAVTVLLGLGVGKIIDTAVPKPAPPDGLDSALWAAMDWRVHTGGWIGCIERLLVLMAFWLQQYAIVGGWLAFKVAAKWEVWKNIIRVPDAMDDVHPRVWYQARVSYGSWLHSRFVLGTLLNVLIGAVGAYVGNHLWNLVSWLCSWRGGA